MEHMLPLTYNIFWIISAADDLDYTPATCTTQETSPACRKKILRISNRTSERSPSVPSQTGSVRDLS